MNFFAYSALLNAFIAGLLGFLIILKNRKELINRLFFSMSISVVFWSLSYWQWMFSSEAVSALFWSRLLTVGSLFIPIFYFHWVLTFVGLNKQKGRLVKFLYLIVFVFLIFSFSSLFVEKVEPKNIFSFWPVPGILYNIYLIFIYFGLVIYSIIILWRQYKIDSEPKKSSIKYIIMGSAVGFMAGATNFFLWYDIQIPPYGNVLVSIYPVVLAVAILKYQLFNVRVVATELLTFVIWIFVLVRTFLADTLQERLINGGLFLFLIISGILLIRSVLREVKHREQIEKLAGELEKANVRLKELDQAKSEFVTITSHQLRAPITAIKGYISMLMEGSFGEIPEKAKTVIDKVYQSSDRLVNLINDFLNLSRIERGKMEYDFKEFDLKELVKNVYEDFSQINIKKETPLEFTFDMNEREKYIVKADQEKIRQAIGNLVDNALKYTKRGFVKMSLYKDTMKEKIIFKIQDSGMGIDREALSRLFQKFSRAERDKLSVHVDGTGLGLYVAKEIMKAHDGDIRAESRGMGKGTEFYVEFPLNFITPQEKKRIEEEQNRRAGNVEEFLKGI